MFLLLGPVGHLVNFGLLAFLLARAIAWKVPFQYQHAILAFAFSLLYGILDEIHQLFTPMRSFQVRDILVNSLGVIIGLTAFSAYNKKQPHKRPEDSLLL